MKKGKHRAVLILPWYGKLPPYFGVYLKSLENVDIDVLWVSDIEVERYPQNFIPLKMSFESLHGLMEKRLGTPVCVNGWHRLCDFKPMYGRIFEDFITGYDYWGWGDCDLVYGKAFNVFLHDTVDAGRYDVVSLQKFYLSGPTAFCRNSKRMRDKFMDAKNWRDVCASAKPEVFVFDECGGQFHSQLASGRMTMSDCERIQDSFPAAVWRDKSLSVFRDMVINESSLKDGEVVSMDEGILTVNGREIEVFHYVRAKAVRWFRCKSPHYPKMGNFKIDSNGFYHSPLSWQTRMLQMPFRKMMAAFEAIRKHGFSHILKRSGLLSQ